MLLWSQLTIDELTEVYFFQGNIIAFYTWEALLGVRLQHLQKITETTILWPHMDLTIPGSIYFTNRLWRVPSISRN